MNTIERQHKEILRVRASRLTPVLFPRFWNIVEAGRFAIIPMLLTVTAYIGGIAATFGTDGSVFHLGLAGFPTILSLALILILASMRAIVYLSALSLLFDLLVLIF